MADNRAKRLAAFKQDVLGRLTGRPLPNGGRVGAWRAVGRSGGQSWTAGLTYERSGWPGGALVAKVRNVHPTSHEWVWAVWTNPPGAEGRVVHKGAEMSSLAAKEAADACIWRMVPVWGGKA